MCCDFAIHDPDPPGHNPHCHIMLTMRAIDENGKWMPKSRKVYDLDENGERIKLPSGRWKSHKESTVDWNEQYHAEEWRHGWEVIQNKYLELAGSAERVDMRSYERQGLDIIPTVHMGAAVSALERKGIQTNIGNLNRDIKAANRMMNAIRSTIKGLRDWIADIVSATREAFAEMEAEKKNASPDLSTLLRDYMNLRKAERSDWSRYGQQKGTMDDLKAVSQALIYVIGKCPRCGGNVTESKLGFFCEHSDCRFGLWKDNRFFSSKRVALNKKVAIALLADGKVHMDKLYSEKTGKEYSADIILVDNGETVRFTLEFTDKKA